MSIPNLILTYVVVLLGGLAGIGIYSELRRRRFQPTDPTQPAADDRVDDAFLWNVTFSGEFRAYHLRYFTGIFNLLDVRDARMGFPTSVDYPQSLIPRYGRSMRAGLSLAF